MSVAQSSGLFRALGRLMPDARLSVLQEKPWHSIAFAGTRIRFFLEIAGEAHRERVADLAELLPEYQFDLGSVLVADIGVTDCVSDDGESRLAIDVLLLDD
jgi:hypothetical protein